MKIKILIADSDASYISRLSSVLEKKDNLIISVFTSLDVMKKSLNTQNYDILLLSKDMDDGSLNYKMASVVIYLLGSECERITSSAPKHYTVFKYQNINSIYNEVINIYSENIPNVNGKNSNKIAKVISVYSPAGGTGKTTVSFAMATGIANHGSRVMYINLENISSYGVFLQQGSNKNFGDIVSKVGSNINWNLKINSIVNRSENGIMYFDELSNVLDIYEISPEDITELIKGIGGADVCDYIIVDMGTSLDKQSRAIFDASDTIVSLVSNSETAVYKFIKFIDRFDVISDNTDKLKIICNMGNDSSKFSNKFHIIGSIPYISNCSLKGIVDYITQKNLINTESLL